MRVFGHFGPHGLLSAGAIFLLVFLLPLFHGLLLGTVGSVGRLAGFRACVMLRRSVAFVDRRPLLLLVLLRVILWVRFAATAAAT